MKSRHLPEKMRPTSIVPTSYIQTMTNPDSSTYIKYIGLRCFTGTGVLDLGTEILGAAPSINQPNQRDGLLLLVRSSYQLIFSPALDFLFTPYIPARIDTERLHSCIFCHRPSFAVHPRYLARISIHESRQPLFRQYPKIPNS